MACSFTSSPAVSPRRGDEDDGDVEKDDESREDRGLFSGCGSPIEDEAEVEDDDDDDDEDDISAGNEAILVRNELNHVPG